MKVGDVIEEEVIVLTISTTIYLTNVMRYV